MKLSIFTARVSGELTKIHQISPLTTNYPPYTDSHLSPPAWQALLLPLRHLSINSIRFLLNLDQIHSTFCKTLCVEFF